MQVRSLPIDYFSAYEVQSCDLVKARLNPIVDAVQLAKTRYNELGDLFVSTSLDANTVQELISSSRGLTGLGAAMIIVIDSCMHEFMRFLGHKCSLDAFPIRNELLAVGPDLDSEKWANVMRCAANYVRHASDWLDKLRAKERESGDPNFWEKTTTDSSFCISHFDSKSSTAQTLNTLVNASVPLGALMDVYLARYYDVAENLGLTDPMNTGRKFHGWVSAVKQFYRDRGML